MPLRFALLLQALQNGAPELAAAQPQRRELRQWEPFKVLRLRRP
ncbi:hypothetical protein [Synechococcus sp. BA-132 BA5]|nr:hypothetical protein [Synechococcus sp. BA-132 BA5]MEA5415276.1 hypothetical protein [Synechococcus sp. BA-132 BA5]